MTHPGAIIFRQGSPPGLATALPAYYKAKDKLAAWKEELKIPHSSERVFSILREMDSFFIQLQRDDPGIHRVLAPERSRIAMAVMESLHKDRVFFGRKEEKLFSSLFGKEGAL